VSYWREPQPERNLVPLIIFGCLGFWGAVGFTLYYTL